MSALPPKADIVQHGGNVRFVPKADISAGPQTVSFGKSDLPDISTPDAVQKMLLDIRSIEFPPPNVRWAVTLPA